MDYMVIIVKSSYSCFIKLVILCTHTHTMIAFASPTHMNEGDFDDQAGSRFYFPGDTG